MIRRDWLPSSSFSASSKKPMILHQSHEIKNLHLWLAQTLEASSCPSLSPYVQATHYLIIAQGPCPRRQAVTPKSLVHGWGDIQEGLEPQDQELSSPRSQKKGENQSDLSLGSMDQPDPYILVSFENKTGPMRPQLRQRRRSRGDALTTRMTSCLHWRWSRGDAPTP